MNSNGATTLFREYELKDTKSYTKKKIKIFKQTYKVKHKLIKSARKPSEK